MLELLALAALLFWLALLLDRSRRWPGECQLPVRAEMDSDPEAPTVAAVVPARNEAAILPHTLPQLLSQEPAPLRVVVVDDGSVDGSGEVARRLGREIGAEDRLQVLRPPARPPGWTGKVWALAHGVAATGDAAEPPDWLLFSDADIRHRPGAVGALLARASSGPYDLVSVMARLHTEAFWERLLIPAFVFFFHLLYPFRRVRRAASPVAAAAGGCILIRPETLERAGGLAAIRDALIDDVALARAVKGGGGRLWLGLDAGIASVRPYRGLRELWRMVARSAFHQLGYRYGLLAAVLLGLVLLVAAPPFLALASGLAYLAPVGEGTTLLRTAVWGLAAWTLEGLALLPFVRHHRVPAPWALALPFAALLYAGMTLSSASQHLRGAGAEWKGRTYRGVDPG